MFRVLRGLGLSSGCSAGVLGSRGVAYGLGLGSYVGLRAC